MTVVQVQLGHGLPAYVSEYASAKVTAALRHTGLPVLYARVRLHQAGDPAVARPSSARVEVDLNGRMICARAFARSPQAAVDLVQQRLLRRLARVGRG